MEDSLGFHREQIIPPQQNIAQQYRGYFDGTYLTKAWPLEEDIHH